MRHLDRILRRHGVPVAGIVHVGAHDGQEVPTYQRAGFDPIVLVEPHPDHAAHLYRTYPQATVIQAAAGPSSGDTELHVTANTQLSSTYQPLRLSVDERLRVPQVRLADVLGAEVSAAVIDVQGAELDVVAGAPLDQLRLIVLETRTRPKYNGAPLEEEVVEHMARLGWIPVRRYPHGAAHRARVHDVVFLPRQLRRERPRR